MLFSDIQHYIASVDERIFLGIIVASVFLIGLLKQVKPRHYLFRWQASRELRKLKKLGDDRPKQYYLLRSINPFVIEEMVLTSLKRAGHKIVRNKRYTGDGGIDGQVYIQGKHYLIQTKRYRNHINPAHMQEFALICKKRGAGGLFVHTGKTGPMSKERAREQNIEIISGEKLFKMLLA